MNDEINNSYNEDYDPIDLFASIVSKQGSFDNVGWVQTVSVRMPGDMVCTFDALAEHSGVSRNKLLVIALEVAIKQLMERLSDTDREKIDALHSAILGKRIEAFSKGVKPEILEV